MTETLMVCLFVVTLLLPFVCRKVQMYVPLSCGWARLMYKLPLENCEILPLSSCFSSCRFHSICGVGVPSALQLIIPEESAIILCWGFKSVNLAVGRINNIGFFVSQFYIIFQVSYLHLINKRTIKDIASAWLARKYGCTLKAFNYCLTVKSLFMKLNFIPVNNISILD